MSTKSKPSFLRLFLGGFVLGAVTLVGVQATQAEQPAAAIATHLATR